jgi:RNA polymerase sigma-70 factor (ECF subfamily)
MSAVRKKFSWSALFPETDEQAMWNVQMNNDHQAFARLVERWEAPIFRLCARMTGDTHQAEDLKQEAFARVYAHRKEFRIESKFSTWLWRIALNLCYDEVRKRQRHGESPLEEEQNGDAGTVREYATDDPSPDLQAVSQEENEILRQALGRLPEMSQAVLVLRYCEGLKLREIAEIVDMSEATVSYRVMVALDQITRILEPSLAERRAAGR